MQNFSRSQPRLCFIGAMVGRNPGYVTTQGLILSDLFRQESYKVISSSSRINRGMRLADIVLTLIRHGRALDIQILEVYSGLSFILWDIASLVGKLMGVRVVMVLHGGYLPGFIARFPNWTRRVFDRAQMIVTPSPFLARAIEPYGYQARVIPNVIDLNDYPFRPRETLKPRLFWMRSFHQNYNPAMAVRVLARLRARFPAATLVMAGNDKGLEADVRSQAAKLGLNGAVSFPGFLDLKGKLQEANSADVFINTNQVDNTPVTILEAWAMGLPVVCTNVGGLPDLVTDGENGLMVADNDDEAMAEAIERLIANPSQARRLSSNGRSAARKFSWESVRAEWEKAFEEIMLDSAP